MQHESGVPVCRMKGCGACPAWGCACRGANEKRGRKSPWIPCPSSRESQLEEHQLEEHHPLRKKSRGLSQAFLGGIRAGAVTCMCGRARGFARSRFPWELALWEAGYREEKSGFPWLGMKRGSRCSVCFAVKG